MPLYVIYGHPTLAESSPVCFKRPPRSSIQFRDVSATYLLRTLTWIHGNFCPTTLDRHSALLFRQLEACRRCCWLRLAGKTCWTCPIGKTFITLHCNIVLQQYLRTAGVHYSTANRAIKIKLVFFAPTYSLQEPYSLTLLGRRASKWAGEKNFHKLRHQRRRRVVPLLLIWLIFVIKLRGARNLPWPGPGCPSFE